MTGLHALHMVIGVGILLTLIMQARKGKFSADYYTPVDVGRALLALRRRHLDLPVPAAVPDRPPPGEIIMSDPNEHTHIDSVGTYVKILVALLIAHRPDHGGRLRRPRPVQHHRRARHREREDAAGGAVLHAHPPQHEAHEVGGGRRPALAGDPAAAHHDRLRHPRNSRRPRKIRPPRILRDAPRHCPTLPHGRGFHEKALPCQAENSGGLRGLAPWRSMRQRLMRASARRTHPPTRKRLLGPCPQGPLSLIPALFLQNGGDLSRARRFGAACEPLTDCLRSVQSVPRERGPGSQGACPLAEFEAAPHARVSAPLPRSISLLCASCIAPWIVLLPVDFLRALSPCFHPHSVCGLRPQVPAGVLNSRGAAISVTNCGSQLPGSRRSAATSQSPQLGAFAYSAEFQSFLKSRILLCCCFSLPSWLPLPPSGCTADRTLPPSPTTDAATPPASAPPPPPLSSSASCCLSSPPPACTFVIPHSFKSLSGAPSPQDAVRCLHQQPSHQHVPRLADP